MGFLGYLKSLIANDTGNSSKSFTLVLSAIISFIAGLVICFSIVYDVINNGFIKSDLESMGIFMLCMGGYMAGGGITKVFGDRVEGRARMIEDRIAGEDVFYENVRPHKRRGRKRKDSYAKETEFAEEDAVADGEIANEE